MLFKLYRIIYKSLYAERRTCIMDNENPEIERDTEYLSQESNFVDNGYGFIGPDGIEYVSIEDYYEIHSENNE